jgi:hypothetical protein
MGAEKRRKLQGRSFVHNCTLQSNFRTSFATYLTIYSCIPAAKRKAEGCEMRLFWRGKWLGNSLIRTTMMSADVKLIAYSTQVTLLI